MEIFKLSPVLKHYIWAGNKLTGKWGKKSGNPLVAESWELSTHKDGKTKISGGGYDGKTLEEVLTKEYLGSIAKKYSRFPLLIKFIDSGQNLSVQVHPNDEYALRRENDYGKTEMWYICDACEGAGIYLGFNKDVTREEVIKATQQNRIESLLNFVTVKKGESYLIKAGTVHAICAGVTICEIQQNSNVTYRVYDYGRKDASGNTRTLHTEKALEVMDYSKHIPSSIKKGNIAAECEYFTVTENVINNETSYCCSSDSFNAVNIIDGNGSIDGRDFSKGDTFFVPSGYGKYTVKGNAVILITKIN